MMIMSRQTQLCFVTKALHFAYCALTYIIFPFVLGSDRPSQWLQAVNLSGLLIHWKLLDDRCILDVVEKNTCTKQEYEDYGNKLLGMDDLAYSNLIQLFYGCAVIIAVSTLTGHPVSVPVRAGLFVLIVALVFFLVPLHKKYECRYIK
jgi:hypothetical protein